MIELDFRSRKPIYEQICEKVKELIAVGEWKSGDQLPAVRCLARELGINHNTIQKAFSALEREGVINSVAGKGSFVSAMASQTEVFKKQALEEIERVIEKNVVYSITCEDVKQLAEHVFAKEKQGRGA
ncbi:MAG: GntR family transcriptional regulator [Massilimaliae sp.]|nr:GntR family transcriptional regulator [Massiliimalia sp.]